MAVLGISKRESQIGGDNHASLSGESRLQGVEAVDATTGGYTDARAEKFPSTLAHL